VKKQFGPAAAPIVRELTAIHLDRGSVVALSHPHATDAALTGAKAAALARAASGGLPVLPGFVITTDAAADIAAAGGPAHVRAEVQDRIRESWEALSHGGRLPLVVRSSSTSEDGATSSMAGMFTSVLDVRGWDAFTEAVMSVLGSAGVVSLDEGIRHAPMAVLVQPYLTAARGGILFGVDPVTGNLDHLTIVAVEGGPDALVSGRKEGIHHVLSHSGRLLSNRNGAPRLLNRHDRRSLARLASSAKDHFGGPQDIEWAIDPAEQLFLLQSRPVTAIASTASGPVLGPGPVAESFPDPLSRLEQDLWIEPLRQAVEHALLVAGAATKRAIARSPIITTTGGRIAADLELFGVKSGKKSLFAKLDPREPARRMVAAWRVGRLKAALPGIVTAIVRRIDEELEGVPEPAELMNEQLLSVVHRSRSFLNSLNGYEVLTGLLGDKTDGSATGAEVALRALMLGRSEGFDDGRILAAHPEVLALTPPAIADRLDLPGTSTVGTELARSVDDLGPREALRLRIRWVQELAARCTWELGRRMIPAGRLATAPQVRLLSLEELENMVVGGRVPEDLHLRSMPDGPPLPAAFRLTSDGVPVPVQTTMNGSGARGAGGGRGIGRVHQGTDPASGDVLVVSILDPSLAPLLPNLGGLVAETGNVLSHLAILAREFGVPTVVGSQGARDRFPEGSVIVVDGTSGDVEEVTEA
jgi:phosphohistidine swiveling domain-containing protein